MSAPEDMAMTGHITDIPDEELVKLAREFAHNPNASFLFEFRENSPAGDKNKEVPLAGETTMEEQRTEIMGKFRELLKLLREELQKVGTPVSGVFMLNLNHRLDRYNSESYRNQVQAFFPYTPFTFAMRLEFRRALLTTVVTPICVVTELLGFEGDLPSYLLSQSTMPMFHTAGQVAVQQQVDEPTPPANNPVNFMPPNGMFH